MSGPAQVRSTPAIEGLQEALAKFAKRVQAALDTLDGEMHRTEDWLEHDRPAHWKRELHAAEDALHAAKMDLERCLMMTVAGQRPACREQKAAVSAAKVRLAYCQQKRDVIRQWQRDFRHESLEYRGRIGQLRRSLEHDVPRARAVLMKILRRIEDYQVERPPEAMVASEDAKTAAAGTAARDVEAVEVAGNSENDAVNEKIDDAGRESAPQPETPHSTPAAR